ncbi:hypothetical protein K9U39_18570 [Rhodoblastus acidophilus]|uniref:Sulfotransferase family protein n=1 Tax=Candidatus Rhodoblastus alkanivorans TaxID=2954117 RepID=A0ABS9Z2N1_9HYPH|nr:hypothetical protein [Candidatus Rhodoblastus alkanivorans]MCI4677504.1 hypothetical protein [Candidatus Rhodoblastus alkanivorans]MCI4681863.1 hypothetical protein [Candidatus Rhodoblastus alkanivorans]MDI4642913.1 hypothetical protein [Rhodoblastus acidophilus]
MTIGLKRRVFHYHLKKCGGTSINFWLDFYQSDDRRMGYEATRELKLAMNAVPRATDFERLMAPRFHQAFFGSSFIGSHMPLLKYAPPGTFAFTVLREPRRRIFSQVADWRRLADYESHRFFGHETKPMVADAVAGMALRDFLARYRKSFALDNYMTRALARVTLSEEEAVGAEAASLVDVALQNLRCFDLVGVTEDLTPFLRLLARDLGIAPLAAAPRLNVSASAENAAPEVEAAADLLDELTEADIRVYRGARALFEEQLAAGPEYSTEMFETEHASVVLADVLGRNRGDVVFSVRSPLVGAGFHGRDGPGLDNCNVWSGPQPRFTLYMPTPPDARLELKLWIRAFADESQRERLRVWTDGRETPHRFAPDASAPEENFREVLIVETRSTRDFIRLEIDVGETFTYGRPGGAAFDSRRRGVAFGFYGWRAIPEPAPDAPDEEAEPAYSAFS